MTDGYGSIIWWGLGPALDLQELWNERLQYDLDLPTKEREINMLVAGAVDPRHLLKTIAQASCHGQTILNIYVAENYLEQYARQMFLLALIMEPPATLGLQEKTELFLEIFGNTLIRNQTYEYIQIKSSEFIKIVTDNSYLEETLPFIKLDLLKYREIDGLENIFKLWRKPDPNLFDISKYWDLRLRKYLGTRYDKRKGVFDWDFSMKLLDRNVGMIGNDTYQNWRETGVAFKIREGNYSFPNKTLCSGHVLKPEGERQVYAGYWGDIISSPYLAFGIECDNQDLLKESNNRYIKNGQDISEYNVLALVYELINGEKYKTSENTESESPSEEAKLKNVETCQPSKSSILKELKGSLVAERVRINFLPLGGLHQLHKKEKYANFFDVAFFSHKMVTCLKPELSLVLKENAMAVIETAKFLLDLRPEQLKTYIERITELAKTAGLKPATVCDPLQDAYAKFRMVEK